MLTVPLAGSTNGTRQKLNALGSVAALYSPTTVSKDWVELKFYAIAVKVALQLGQIRL